MRTTPQEGRLAANAASGMNQVSHSWVLAPDECTRCSARSCTLELVESYQTRWTMSSSWRLMSLEICFLFLFFAVRLKLRGGFMLNEHWNARNGMKTVDESRCRFTRVEPATTALAITVCVLSVTNKQAVIEVYFKLPLAHISLPLQWRPS